MAQTGYVHGGTDEREVARLEKQADFTASFTFSTLDVHDGHRVLDLATGVGAMGVRLQRTWPNAQIVGVDLSSAQLSAARKNHPALPVLRGDATRLPFENDTFDRVHCSWLLEHVPSPVAVLREVRRVLKPGGFCQFVEVDNATFGTTPPTEAVFELMRRLNAAQLAAGGDPYIGERIHRAFGGAGFRRFEITRHPLRGSSKNPALFQACIDEFAEIFEGLDESLGAASAQLISDAIAELRALPSQPNAQFRYTPVITRAWK
ncbi:MAG: class I SAM-dependent methyltransferase [Archangium sp.]